MLTACRLPLSVATSFRTLWLLALLLPALLTLCRFAAWWQIGSGSTDLRRRVEANFAALPLSFETNQGQATPGVDFYSTGAGYALSLQADQATFSFHTVSRPTAPNDRRGAVPQRSALLRMQVLGADPQAQATGLEKLPGKTNYFLGRDPRKWQRNIPTFQKVQYSQVYPGIDLLYYGNRNKLEYDFVVAPHVSPVAIRLRFSGQNQQPARATVDEQGDLRLHTPEGEVRQSRPVAYQEVGGERRPVTAEYVVVGEEVAFRLGAYDPSLPLVIDPVLVYSTFLGGNQASSCADIAVDASGCVYVTGNIYLSLIRNDPAFPTTEDAYSRTTNTSYVTKLSADGRQLIYSTFLGGQGTTYAIAINSAGEAYVTGTTRDNSFPLRQAIQSTLAENDYGDAFVTQFNADGSDLLFSTYLGGRTAGAFPPHSAWDELPEIGMDLVVDQNENIYVVGLTASREFPVTPDAFQAALKGRTDGFLTRINANYTLGYSTYLGGELEDIVVGLALGASGRVYLSGSTGSRKFPTTTGAFCPVPREGWDYWNLFATQIDLATSSLQYSTYLGPTGDSQGSALFSYNFDDMAIAVDATGSAFIVGTTSSLLFPTTAGALDRTVGAGGYTGFVTRLHPDGTSLLYSTFLGGNHGSRTGDVLLDADGNACVTGITSREGFPVTEDPFDPNATVYVTRLNRTGTGVDYSLCIGSADGGSYSSSIALGPENRIYIAGGTIEKEFPTTPDAYLPEMPPPATVWIPSWQAISGCGFIAWFRPRVPDVPTELKAQALNTSQIRLTWKDGSPDETGFALYRRTGTAPFALVTTLPANRTSHTDTGLKPETTCTYVVRATAREGNSPPTNEASATTLPEPPAAPTNLIVTVLSSTSLRVGWRDRSANEFGFRLERRLESGSFARIADPGADDTSYTDSGLKANTRYTYRLQARNIGGSSPYSNEAPGLTLPATPTALQAVVKSTHQIDLTWTQEATGAESFQLERRQGSNPFALLKEVAANTRIFADDSVSPATAYIYRLRAVNASGKSGYSNLANAGTPPEPPAAPSALGVRVLSSNSLQLGWKDRSPNESGFRIERKQETGAFARIVEVGADIVTYTNPGLAANTRYQYRVQAVNAGGSSAFTPEASGLTLPAAPTELRATANGSREIALTWSQATTGADRFRLERRTGSSAFTRLTEVAGTLRAYADRSASPATAYVYRVKALNASGESLTSNEAATTTASLPPAAPSELKVIPLTSSFLRLTWKDNSTNESGFRLERRIGAAAYAQVSALLPNVTTYADTGLEPNTRYLYRLRAWNAGGESAPTPEAAGLTLPLAPTSLRATLGSQRDVTLTWTQDVSGAAGFQIDRQDGTANFRQIAQVGGAVRIYQEGGLAPNLAYTYRVRAFNASGASDYATAPPVTTPLRLLSVVIEPAQLKGGKKAWGTVTLDGPAPTGGAVIPLTSSLGAVRVPASVTIPAGAASARFQVTTKKIKARKQATVSASYRGEAKTALVTVRP